MARRPAMPHALLDLVAPAMVEVLGNYPALCFFSAITLRSAITVSVSAKLSCRKTNGVPPTEEELRTFLASEPGSHLIAGLAYLHIGAIPETVYRGRPG